VFQLLATAVNFPVVLVRGEPAFSLPFRSLDDVLAAAPMPGLESARKRRNSVTVAGGAT
jgi:hypothetical protein